MLGLLCTPSSAQLVQPDISTTTPLTSAPQIVPATPFVWAATTGLGPVAVPFPGAYGWFLVQEDQIEARLVTSLSGDPTIEAIFFPPSSGHPTRAERITIQVPLSPKRIPGSGALVIAFHSYGVSEKDIWVNTGLPQYCREKGYTLVAPYGMVDTHYGNKLSQDSLDHIMKTIGTYFPYDKDRVYTVGFSMGGGAAMSYAMRHLSEDGIQVAGVVNHTGTQDLIDVYNSGTIGVKMMLQNDKHFGGSPVAADGAFEYKRVSPAIMLGSGAVDSENTPAENLAHIPIYTFLNLDDPQTGLIQDNLAVSSYLQGLGANVNLTTINGGAVHSWSTMDLDAAMDWVTTRVLPDTPTSATIYADLDSKYFGTTVRAKDKFRVSFYEFAANKIANTVSVTRTRSLKSLVLDVLGLKLDPTLPLGLTWGSTETLGDEIVFQGYPTKPTSVTMGGLPFAGWSHDRIAEELTITVPAGPLAATFEVLP